MANTTVIHMDEGVPCGIEGWGGNGIEGWPDIRAEGIPWGIEGDSGLGVREGHGGLPRRGDSGTQIIGREGFLIGDGGTQIIGREGFGGLR